MENFRFTENETVALFLKRNVISTPGKYTATVMNDPQALADSGKIRKPVKGGKTQISIANFNAVTPYHMEKFREFMSEGDYQRALKQNLTTSIRDCDYMPVQGETMEIFIATVETNAGAALMITKIRPVPVKESEKMTMESLLGISNSVEESSVEIKDTEAEFMKKAKEDEVKSQKSPFQKA